MRSRRVQPRRDGSYRALLAALPTVSPAAEPEPVPQPSLVVADPVGVNLRAEPAMASPVIATLPRGTLVDPQREETEDAAAGPGWRHVMWNGRAGWVAAGLFAPAAGGP